MLCVLKHRFWKTKCWYPLLTSVFLKKPMLFGFLLKKGCGDQSHFCIVWVLVTLKSLHLSSPLPHDSHSRSLTMTQLLTMWCAHRATTVFSRRSCTSHSPPSRDCHSHCHFSSRSQKVSFISMFGYFCVGVFGCFCVFVFVHENAC